MDSSSRSPRGNYGYRRCRTIQVPVLHGHRDVGRNSISFCVCVLPRRGRLLGRWDCLRYLCVQLAEGNPRVAQGNRSEYACAESATETTGATESISMAFAATTHHTTRGRQVHAKRLILMIDAPEFVCYSPEIAEQVFRPALELPAASSSGSEPHHAGPAGAPFHPEPGRHFRLVDLLDLALGCARSLVVGADPGVH